jgi:hypothetical protein
MQALKALVIVMGILIAVGVAVLGVTIYNRATKMVTGDKPAPVAASIPPFVGAATPQGGSGAQVSPPLLAPGAPATNFGVRDLGLPAGSTIASVQPLSGRVLVEAHLPDGGTRILLLDPTTGGIAGEWHTPGGASGAPAATSPTPASPAPSSPSNGGGTQPLPADGSGRP